MGSSSSKPAAYPYTFTGPMQGQGLYYPPASWTRKGSSRKGKERYYPNANVYPAYEPQFYPESQPVYPHHSSHYNYFQHPPPQPEYTGPPMRPPGQPAHPLFTHGRTMPEPTIPSHTSGGYSRNTNTIRRKYSSSRAPPSMPTPSIPPPETTPYVNRFQPPPPPLHSFPEPQFQARTGPPVSLHHHNQTQPPPPPSFPQPGTNFSQPRSNFLERGPTFSEPGPSFSERGPTFPESGPGFSEQRSTFPERGPTFPEPGPTFPEPRPTFPEPGPTFPEPGPTFPEPGPTFPEPGPSFPQPSITRDPPQQAPMPSRSPTGFLSTTRMPEPSLPSRGANTPGPTYFGQEFDSFERPPGRNPLPRPPADVWQRSPYHKVLRELDRSRGLDSLTSDKGGDLFGSKLTHDKKSRKNLFRSMSSSQASGSIFNRSSHKRSNTADAFTIPASQAMPHNSAFTYGPTMPFPDVAAAAPSGSGYQSAATPSGRPRSRAGSVPLASGRPNVVRVDHFGKYQGFVNDSPHRVLFQDKMFPSALHLYEAMKFLHRPELVERIRACSRVHDVYPLTASLQEHVRSDWGQVALRMMEEVLYQKFKQHPDIRSLLLNTGLADIIYADANSYWGEGAMRDGANELGKALMRIRERLRAEGYGV